jgi:hypothetical protein
MALIEKPDSSLVVPVNLVSLIKIKDKPTAIDRLIKVPRIAEIVFLVNFEKYLENYLTNKITAEDYEYYLQNIKMYCIICPYFTTINRGPKWQKRSYIFITTTMRL